MHVRPTLALIPALVWLAAVPATAQVVQLPAAEVFAPRPYQVPVLPQPRLTLDDAVLLTLRHNPALLSGTEQVRLAQGRLQETRGLFDVGLRLAPALTFTLQEISPGLRSRELQKRNTVRGVRNNFNNIAAGQRLLLQGDLTTVPVCPRLFGFGGLDFSDTGINLDLADPTEIALSGVDRTLSPAPFEIGGNLGSIITTQICRTQPRQIFSAEGFLGVWREAIRVIDFTGGRGLEGALLSASQITREVTLLREEIARTVAERADIALGRLGPIGRDELRRNAIFDASIWKPFRSGMSLRADFQVQSQEHNFIGKPLDPSFGGLDVRPMFFSSIGGTWIQPLGRGRGESAAAAAERSAEPLVVSEQEQLRHGVTEEVFRTVLSYLNLIGAQERIRVIEESRTRQADILRLTQQRIAAGDIAQIELERVRARDAALQSALAQTQTDVIGARVALADTIGAGVSSLEAAPVAADAFATGIADLPDVQTLVAQSATLRHDTRAAAARQASAVADLEGIRTEARPLFDMSLTAGFLNLYESPFFKYLPDEAEPIVNSRATIVTPPVNGTSAPPVSPGPVRYWEPQGYYRALKGRYEPFATIKFTWELPFGNNRAKGRAAQAQATLTTTNINAQNLTRVIAENVVNARETVDRAARGVVQWEAAVANSRRTYESQQRLLESGNVTLIDVLLTEEDLAQQQLQLLLQQFMYRSAIARLKFELGELVVFENPGTANEQIRVASSSFTVR